MIRTVKTLYRYDDPLGLEFGELTLREFDVIIKTPKGYWINKHLYGYKKRWVKDGGKNVFAYASQEEALKNYIERKKFQIDIKEFQLDYAKHNLNNAEEILKNWKENKDAES